MLVELRQLNGSQAGSTWTVVGTQYVIGRHADCLLRIDHPKVSLHHCAVLILGNEVWVRDLRSTNGTFVNDTQVTGEYRLGIGDVLRVGPAEFEVLQRTTGAIRQDDRQQYPSTQLEIPSTGQGKPPPTTSRKAQPRS
jgi:pSer/pThr/pTyr-binding forkhead associated (FHA) protein